MEAKSRRKHRGYCRLTAVLLSGAMAVTSCLAGADLTSAAEPENTELQNPRVEMNTCDTVYFGNYWQEDTNGDGVADQNDDKTPIRWRILSRNGNDAYVLADQALDRKPYHEEYESVTWETSTLRKWLNEEFYHTAFTAEEQEAVLEQTLANADNEEYGTPGGADTVDKVYLPSYDDIRQEEYGFSADAGYGDPARVCRPTDYAVQQGAWAYNEWSGQIWWWLRSPGYHTYYASYVNIIGYGDSCGGDVSISDPAVRPALHLNLSSPLVLSGEGKEISQKSASWDLVELGTWEGKPITWRVLSVSGEEAFLLSDRALANKPYHDTGESITWKDCTLRSWMNGDFYREAFSEGEKAGIQLYQYAKEDNPGYGTEGGEDTADYLTLLSLQDIINPDYGFPEINCGSFVRIAYDDSENGNGWWLRSPGYDTSNASDVSCDGFANDSGSHVDYNDVAVRPALHFDLSAHSLAKAGTVTATAEGNEYQGEVSNPTDQPETTKKPELTGKPDTTQNPATTGKPNTTQIPSVTDKPDTTDTPSAAVPTVTPSGTTGAGSSDTAGTTSVSASAPGSAKNRPAKLSIKNKKQYPLSKKLTIQDADGIRSVKLNGKTIKIKSGKKKISFKFSKYKKKLKKKGKWNKLVVIDQKGKKTTVKFKIK